MLQSGGKQMQEVKSQEARLVVGEMKGEDSGRDAGGSGSGSKKLND